MVSGKSATILIIEDEQAIREMLAYTLMKEGYACLEAADVGQARTHVQDRQPDLILLDWMLPGGESGVRYASQIRRSPKTEKVPIIMLTAKGGEEDIIAGLNAGADDYLIKPFSTRELLARIKALLRRAMPREECEVIDVGGLVLTPEYHRVSIHDQAIKFTVTEFKLLHFFVTHPERVYSRSQLLEQVWDERICVEERTIDVHIRRLRKILQPHGYAHYIKTVHGIGYRFSTHA